MKMYPKGPGLRFFQNVFMNWCFRQISKKYTYCALTLMVRLPGNFIIVSPIIVPRPQNHPREQASCRFFKLYRRQSMIGINPDILSFIRSSHSNLLFRVSSACNFRTLFRRLLFSKPASDKQTLFLFKFFKLISSFFYCLMMNSTVQLYVTQFCGCAADRNVPPIEIKFGTKFTLDVNKN